MIQAFFKKKCDFRSVQKVRREVRGGAHLAGVCENAWWGSTNICKTPARVCRVLANFEIGSSRRLVLRFEDLLAVLGPLAGHVVGHGVPISIPRSRGPGIWERERAIEPLDRASFTGLVLGCIKAKFCK